MPKLNKVLTATIANGASLSDIMSPWPSSLAAIVMPAAWTTAGLTFQGSVDGTNFFDIKNDSGDEYIIPVVASDATQFNQPLAFPFIKVRSGTSGTPVNQGAARSISLICN